MYLWIQIVLQLLTICDVIRGCQCENNLSENKKYIKYILMCSFCQKWWKRSPSFRLFAARCIWSPFQPWLFKPIWLPANNWCDETLVSGKSSELIKGTTQLDWLTDRIPGPLPPIRFIDCMWHNRPEATSVLLTTLKSHCITSTRGGKVVFIDPDWTVGWVTGVRVAQWLLYSKAKRH